MSYKTMDGISSTSVDDVTEATDELTRFEGPGIKVKHFLTSKLIYCAGRREKASIPTIGRWTSKYHQVLNQLTEHSLTCSL